MNNAELAYLLGCIDPFVDEKEMTEEDLHYFSNSEVQNAINQMKILCFKYVIKIIDKENFDNEYNVIINNHNLGEKEKEYINKRKINLLDMMLKPPKEKETINDGKFHWGDEFDEIKQKKLEKKEGI